LHTHYKGIKQHKSYINTNPNHHYSIWHLLLHVLHVNILCHKIIIPYPKENHHHYIHEEINYIKFIQFYFYHLLYKLILEYLDLYYVVLTVLPHP